MAVHDRSALKGLEERIVGCRRCPRLVEWRERVAREKRAAFRDEDYWGRPLPGFGDPRASVYVLGLAPAAHGGNRTGRVFTGDRSADWLFASMHRTGFANQPTSVHRDDGLRLDGAFVSAAVRCAPPANKPLPAERDNCLPYAAEELALVEPRVIVCLGAFAWDAACRLLGLRPKPRFGHGAEFAPPEGRTGAARLLSPQPAEHVHRQADRADDRCGVLTGAGARPLVLAAGSPPPTGGQGRSSNAGASAPGGAGPPARRTTGSRGRSPRGLSPRCAR